MKNYSFLKNNGFEKFLSFGVKSVLEHSDTETNGETCFSTLRATLERKKQSLGNPFIGYYSKSSES